MYSRIQNPAALGWEMCTKSFFICWSLAQATGFLLYLRTRMCVYLYIPLRDAYWNQGMRYLCLSIQQFAVLNCSALRSFEFKTIVEFSLWFSRQMVHINAVACGCLLIVKPHSCQQHNSIFAARSAPFSRGNHLFNKNCISEMKSSVRDEMKNIFSS